LEVEVESTDREYVDAKLDQYLNAGALLEPPAAGGRAEARRRRPMSIGEFVRQINPVKKNEVAATIAYFLEFHADPPVEEWKPDQIADRFPDVRKPKPANMTDLLLKSNFFMGVREKGSYRLSEAGVNWVDAQEGSHEG
jgi:hypothetical protein